MNIYSLQNVTTIYSPINLRRCKYLQRCKYLRRCKYLQRCKYLRRCVASIYDIASKDPKGTKTNQKEPQKKQKEPKGNIHENKKK